MINKNEKIKKYLENKEYKKCAEILEEEIINYVVKAIRKKETNYVYTNLLDLIEDSKRYIEDDDKYIADKIRFFDDEDETELFRLERLLTLCDTYQIKIGSNL